VSKGTLVGLVSAAVVVVAALAVLTPTVIVRDDSGPRGIRVAVQAPAAPGFTPYAPAPYGLPGPTPNAPTPRVQRQQLPGLQQNGRLKGLQVCLQKHGLGLQGRNAPPDLQTMRDALKACRGTLPGAGFGR
jgi:hypothetical protein